MGDDIHSVTGETDVARLPYRRPQLGRVRLEADQVLTAGCKVVPLATGSGTSTCTGGLCNATTGS
jgi:hypothetical protein